MSEVISCAQIIEMIRRSADNIKANHEMLSKLDSIIGDGDHGAAMLRVANTIDKAIENTGDTKHVKPLLSEIGWSVMAVDGGSTGPLMGALFSGMGEAVEDSDTIDGQILSSMFNAALEKVRKLTKAQVGDKTMIDALVPAVDGFNLAIKESKSISAALEQAAEAASEGAEATKNMQAKFGRAKNMGDRTIGHIDPGAKSISLIFQGFCSALKNDKNL